MTTADRDLAAAAEAALEPLRRRVLARIGRLLGAAAIDPAGVRCTIEAEGSAVTVVLDIPAPVSRSLEKALGVRVLDAVRSSGRTFGVVDVIVRASSAPFQGAAAP